MLLCGILPRSHCQQADRVSYALELDSAAFWDRLVEHIFVGMLLAWISRGFLVRKQFRLDLLEAHLMQVEPPHV